MAKTAEIHGFHTVVTDRPTDQPTDQSTFGQTDKPSYRDVSPTDTFKNSGPNDFYTFRYLIFFKNTNNFTKNKTRFDDTLYEEFSWTGVLLYINF